MVSLLLSFAYIDGGCHPKEIEIIKRTCVELDIDPSLITIILQAHHVQEGDFVTSCRRAMLKITDENLQNKALVALCDIAIADDKLDENEQMFLVLASEHWGVQAIGHHDFVLDDHQRQVVEADRNERQEVHAGPGMGKTFVACARVSKLIEAGIEPSNIWLLSFTRTAVQEIRNRIKQFAEDLQSVLGVKIGTIDSRAWRIRCGFSDGEVDRLFGGYDASIHSVIDMIEENPRDIREFLESLDHIIIDEAQDITGPRARLISKILKLLPAHCGVTVFADSAQAIYGWTTDGEDIPEEDRVNLLDIFKDDPGHTFIQRELQTIHRTNAPNLIDMIEELRLDIYVNENIDTNQFIKRREIIVTKANERLNQFDAKELPTSPNTLVLFRRRPEVLMASSFANSEKVQHRIRMSGLPSMVHPCFGKLFADYTDPTIDENEFSERWNTQHHYFSSIYASPKSVWDLVFSLGQREGVVHVSEIRKKLSRRPPDISATIPDLGVAGPIIGTIHASKGREADEVILRLPLNQTKFPEGKKLDEESRVMFVGASRAKNRLYVGRGFLRASFAPSLESGRSFMPHKPAGKFNWPVAQIEIGRESDLDPYSVVSKNYFSQAEALEIQQQLAELVDETPVPLDVSWPSCHDFNYQIRVKSDGASTSKPIGYFTQHLNKELFSVLHCIPDCSNMFRPPEWLPHLYLIGVSTFATNEDDARLQETHEPFATTGIWLIPIVLGYPKVHFLRKKRRNKWL